MKHTFSSFSKSTIAIIIICFFLGIGALFFAICNVNNYKQQRIEKTQKELSIYVDVISNGLKELFLDDINHLTILANDPTVKESFLLEESHNFSKDFCPIENLYNQDEPRMSSITMITSEGKLFHRHPFLSDSIIDYSDHDDVAHVLKKREDYISNVFINLDGKPSISISHPVFDNTNFIGIVRITVYTETLIDLFVKPILERDREVRIFNKNGNYLNVNKNILKYNYKKVLGQYKTEFSKHNWRNFEEVMENISNKESGVAVFDEIDAETIIMKKKIAAYGSFEVFNEIFSIIVSKDYNLVMLPTKQYKNKFWVFIIIVLLSFLIVTITLISNRIKHIKLLEENKYLKEIAEKSIEIKKQKENYYSLTRMYLSQNKKLNRSRNIVEKSKSKYKSLFDNMSEAFALHKIIQDEQNKVIDYIFIEINDAYELQTGLDRDKIINKKVSEVFPGIEKDPGNLIETYGKVALSDEPLKFVQFSEHLRKWYAFSVFSPQQGYFATLFSDITEIKKKEKAILQFGKIIEDSLNEIYIFDANTYKFIQINRGARINIGYNMDELKEMTPINIKPEYTKELFDELLKPLNDGTKEIISFTTKHQRKDGTIYPVELTLKLINYMDRKAVLAFAYDITEREKNQQKILNATILAEEKERNRVGKELHDGISPLLSTINLFVQSLKKPKEHVVQNDLYQRIENVLHETIKSISEISNNLSPHILYNFGLNTAIERFIENFSRICNINIDFNSDLNGKTPDKYKITIYRVTTELLNNTYKYANATEIIISITKNSMFEFDYKDNGDGFEVKNAISSKKGMGLFNIINRIESLNGKIIIDSAIGKGLNVKITLPII